MSGREPGVEFQALLERLELRALELSQASDAVREADGLAASVDHARASLHDALSLGDRLLEAYRQATRQVPGRPENQAPKEPQ